jgi:hypothetical protein
MLIFSKIINKLKTIQNNTRLADFKSKHFTKNYICLYFFNVQKPGHTRNLLIFFISMIYSDSFVFET